MIKKYLRPLLRRAGYAVVRTDHAAIRYVEHPVSGVLDEVLLRLFGSLTGLRFIQIGANDGIRADPIRRYIDAYGWLGVLVEPLPQFMKPLRARYAHRADLRFLDAAVDRVAGERQMYLLPPDAPGLPDWAHGLASFSSQRLEDSARQLGLPASMITTQPVRTVTWADVRALFGSSRCDLLVVDVEGFDVQLLRLAELATWRPRIIQFEHVCVSRAERMSMYEELVDLGYELATADDDTIAYLPRIQPS